MYSFLLFIGGNTSVWLWIDSFIQSGRRFSSTRSAGSSLVGNTICPRRFEIAFRSSIVTRRFLLLSAKGQDQTSAREGGTWLCLNTVQGRAGVLVNLPSRMTPEQKAQAQSRGFLVPNFVNDPNVELDSYLDELQTTKMNYTGFNLLALERTPKSTWVPKSRASRSTRCV